jgi:uncharacterized repeat protein (TIGR03987 family)
LLFKAVIFMNIALVFYTWAVFSARRKGLHKKHLFIFGTGLLCDYIGTRLMLDYGLSNGVIPEWHIIAGMASLCGMAFHFSLALMAAVAHRVEVVNRLFHRVSLYIYSGWIIAFISGSFAGIFG